MRLTFLFSGFLEGIWMLIDGFQLMRASPNRFSNDELWNRLVRGAGIDPAGLGPLLLALGILWLLVTISVATNVRRARLAAVILGCASLWYAIPGTILALINLFALSTLRDRARQGP